MKFIVFISSLTFVHAVIQNNAVVINGVRHWMEVLYESTGLPDTLCVDYLRNHLYFRTDRKAIGRIDLNTRKFKNMIGADATSAVAIDQNTYDVYVGATDGIYKYNPKADKLELVGAAGVNIWSAYFNEVLYYNARNSNTLYKLVDGQSIKVVELDANHVDVERKKLFIDNDDIYFSYSKVLYRQKIGTKAVVLYTGKHVDSVTADRNNNMYFSTSSGIYEILKNYDTVKKIISINNCSGLAFDSENNIIFSHGTNIYRLKPDVEIIETKRIIEDVDKRIDNLEAKVETKFDNFEAKIETKFNNLENKMNEQLTEILQLLKRNNNSTRTIPLVIRNISIDIDDSHH